MNLTELSKDELLTGLLSLVSQRRVLEARLLAYLVEVERRALHLQEACPTIYEFCVERLRMSEDESARRVAAARIASRYPVVLERIEAGKLHLTNMLLLREQLTPENHVELLDAAAGKTKAQLQVWLAARAPRPDVPSSVTPIAIPASGNVAIPGLAAPPSKARIEPLSAQRFRIEFSASDEFRERLQRVRELMSHSNPSGDLEKLFGAALEHFEKVMEKQVLAKVDVTRPSKRLRSNRPYVERATRGAVFRRDGRQCTFVDEQGRRCSGRWRPQLDHVHPSAMGGSDEASNLAVKCWGHNHLAAVEAFGREHVEKKIREKRAARAAKAKRAAVALAARPIDTEAAVALAARPIDTKATVALEPSQLTAPAQKQADPGVASALARKPGARVQREDGSNAEDLALRALTGLGFKKGDAQRALAIVEERGGGGAIEVVLREALRVLA